MTVNQSITQAMARTMQDFSDMVFINMVNITLVRCDSYLDYLKPWIEHDILAALRNSTLHMASLFPDSVISKAEEEIANRDDKPFSGSFHKKSGRYHPYSELTGHQPEIWTTSLENNQLLWSVQKGSWLGLQLLTATGEESEFL